MLCIAAQRSDSGEALRSCILTRAAACFQRAVVPWRALPPHRLRNPRRRSLPLRSCLPPQP
eukprot:3953929-Prymnesium_polylepis.1